MRTRARDLTSILGRSLRRAALLPALLCALIAIASNSAQAQTLSVIHDFTGRADGNGPEAGLTIDGHDNLYGTTASGGSTCSCGTAFKLTQRGSGWTLAPLYMFQGDARTDGNAPQSKVIIGPNGTLYGTTAAGGEGTCNFGEGCGTVYNLRPPASAPASALTPWTETVLYRFAGGADGESPGPATLVFDSTGNLYGTTELGGSAGLGTVYKLTPGNGGWTKTELHSFTGAQDGSHPMSGVIFDNAGNLYGTTSDGGANGLGTVYQLTPAGSGWTETTLHAFSGSSDGQFPWGAVLSDGAGNFYGTTTSGGDGNAGTAYKLTFSNGSWSFAVIHSFTRSDAASPVDSLIMDSSGSLYGTALNGGLNNIGAVFKLMPSDGSWSFRSLHNFSDSDGNFPFGSLVFDQSGNLYGTTEGGGTNENGVVFNIVP
ncbi:MAG: choice-of-anchor tandem repeat GloVer-containing protein [Candidatus Korobacteraceae bacterium]